MDNLQHGMILVIWIQKYTQIFMILAFLRQQKYPNLIVYVALKTCIKPVNIFNRK